MAEAIGGAESDLSRHIRLHGLEPTGHRTANNGALCRMFDKAAWVRLCDSLPDCPMKFKLRAFLGQHEGQAWDEPLPAHHPTISGPKAHDGHPNGMALLEAWARKQQEEEKTEKTRATIDIPGNRPVVIAILGDLHIGNNEADYLSMWRDVKAITGNANVYVLTDGDKFDNWIGKFADLQRGQACPFVEELAIAEAIVDALSDRLLAVVSGNHEYRTQRAAGVDLVRDWLRHKGIRCLYDPDELGFDVRLGGASWRFKLRHKWAGTSIYNQTHAIERDARFGDPSWDVGIGGHLHGQTVVRPFAHGGRIKYAVQLGSYHRKSRYGTQLGLPALTPLAGQASPGAAVLILHPDGQIETSPSIEIAARRVNA